MKQMLPVFSLSCFFLFLVTIHGQLTPTDMQTPTTPIAATGATGPTGFPAGTGPSTGNISGVLNAEDGKSVQGLIRAARTAPLPPVVSNVATGTDGGFQFTGLQSGSYELCATVPGGGYVDPCLWERSGLIVNVAGGQTAAATFTLRKASTLKVHVQDTGKLIKDSPQGTILLAVFSSGRFYPLAKKNEDSNGRDYEISVPFDREFYFSIRPVKLTVVDSNNASADDGSSLKLNFGRNGPGPAVLNYRVTGKK